MVTKEWPSVMTKGPLGRVMRPCALRGCGIKTNKRYHGPFRELYAACCASHAQLAYAKSLVRPALQNRPPGDQAPVSTWETVGASARPRR
mgnify:CR=1 FL=1